MTKNDRKPMNELTGVRYLRDGARIITVDQFSGVGVEASEDLRWDETNDFIVPISAVNAATVDYLSDLDEFELLQVEGDLRCENRKHAVLLEPGLIEVKCSSRKCGADARTVVLHRFSTQTGELTSTVRLKNP